MTYWRYVKISSILSWYVETLPIHTINFCFNILSCVIIFQTTDHFWPKFNLNFNCIQCYQCKELMRWPTELVFPTPRWKWSTNKDSPVRTQHLQGRLWRHWVSFDFLMSKTLKCDETMHLKMIEMEDENSVRWLVTKQYRKINHFPMCRQ